MRSRSEETRGDETHRLTSKDEGKVETFAMLQAPITTKQQELQALVDELAQVKGSTAWRIIQVVWRIRVAVAPHGSWQERVGCQIMGGLRTWRAEGYRIRLRSSDEKALIKDGQTSENPIEGLNYPTQNTENDRTNKVTLWSIFENELVNIDSKMETARPSEIPHLFSNIPLDVFGKLLLDIPSQYPNIKAFFP